jgi:hypothetical protein
MPERQFVVGGTAHTLDVRPDRLDLRDRPYTPPTLMLPPVHPAPELIQDHLPGYVRAGLVLDQGEEGACTGFGLAAVINYLSWVRAGGPAGKFTGVSPHMLYDLARFYDEWPGQDYEGSSCRGAMKGWHKHGVCEPAYWERSIHPTPAERDGRAPGYRPPEGWPADAARRPLGIYYRIDRRSVTDLQAAICHVGAVYVSACVHAGWALETNGRVRSLSHARLPRIAFAPDTQVDGGHAFALVGYNEDGFVVQNSWGTGWGAQGFAVLRYADWVAHGMDAWVCTLGVPQSPASAAGQGSVTRRAPGISMLAGDSRPRARPVAAAAQPWPTEQAYLHSLVCGNDGLLEVPRPDMAGAAQYVQDVALERPLAWFGANADRVPRVAVFAHGGLNSEAEAIARARVLGPYFTGNGIYPIFAVWKTGLWETAGFALEDQFGRAPEEAGLATGVLGEARDRLIEATAHGPLRWTWRQMKANALLASAPGGATELLADALAQLVARLPGVEIHLVGHSAGAFVLGHLMSEPAAPPASSLTLYAPACPLRFALDHLAPRAPLARTWLHLLTDQAERDDSVGASLLYGKSLLYLVARGFEDTRKTPLAGLARCLDEGHDQPDDDLWAAQFFGEVQAWRTWVAGLAAQADGTAAVEYLLAARFRPDQSRPPTHGAFDNDIATLTRTLNRMLGQPPLTPLALPVEDLDY